MAKIVPLDLQTRSQTKKACDLIVNAKMSDEKVIDQIPTWPSAENDILSASRRLAENISEFEIETDCTLESLKLIPWSDLIPVECAWGTETKWRLTGSRNKYSETSTGYKEELGNCTLLKHCISIIKNVDPRWAEVRIKIWDKEEKRNQQVSPLIAIGNDEPF